MRTPIGLLNRQNELCRPYMPSLGDSSRGTITEFLVLYRIVRIAQDHPAGWYHISLRSLTTALKEPNQRCTTDTNRWECVSDRRGAVGGLTRSVRRNPRRARPPPSKLSLALDRRKCSCDCGKEHDERSVRPLRTGAMIMHGEERNMSSDGSACSR